MSRFYTEWSELPAFENTSTAVTWGIFDGVHTGHRRIINQTVRLAEKKDWDSLLMTFRRHPEQVLRGEGPGFLLCRDRRREIIEKSGIDHLLEVEFDLDFAGLEPPEYYREILRDQFSAGGVVLGRDARFGKDRKGDLQTLRDLGAKDRLEVRTVNHARHGGKRISSTRIREAVEDNRIQEAKAMLGRPPEIDGTVEKGRGRGRDLGFPTANLDLHNDITPPPGIYGGIARIEESETDSESRSGADRSFHPAVASIGYRPTFPGEENLVHEVHILNFDRDIYGRHVQFFVLEFIREEEDFETVEALVSQMEADIREFRNSSAYPGEAGEIEDIFY